MFIWNFVFDPVVVAMRSAVGARAPAYVDDIVALVRGPKQAARVLFSSLLQVTAQYYQRRGIHAGPYGWHGTRRALNMRWVRSR